MIGEIPRFVLDTQIWPPKKSVFPEKDDSLQPFMPGMALGTRSLSTPTEANADKYLVFGIHTLSTDFRDDRVAVPP